MIEIIGGTQKEQNTRLKRSPRFLWEIAFDNLDNSKASSVDSMALFDKGNRE